MIVFRGYWRAARDASTLLFWHKKEKEENQQHPSSSSSYSPTVYGSEHSFILSVNAMEHVIGDVTLDKKIRKNLIC